jgi:hypothetical protein
LRAVSVASARKIQAAGREDSLGDKGLDCAFDPARDAQLSDLIAGDE